ncbi:MAG TPA: hemolysin III family protein [Gemmatimonadales bacterium]|nr:hemolysin III family protein [Gemmatimonadales bacterium]
MANSVSHGFGFVAALMATPSLVRAALRRGDPTGVVAVSVFAATLVFLYLASTLYHAVREGRAKRAFRVLDHGAAYLLIAGTYTPFTLVSLHGAWGWTLFAVVWVLAILGIVLTAVGALRHPQASTALFLGMGWLIVVAIRPLWLHLPLDGFIWLVAGGMAYTIGVGFLAMDRRIRYGHFVWHLLVLVGSACHYIAVLRYAA